MGALHAGHLSLVRLAQRKADRVVVSIFVNPAQFAPHEDLATYPRPFASDIAALSKLGADLVWAPAGEVMYPPDFAIRLVPTGAALAGLEDAFRPHFFGGVATVVAKLFLQCQADIAVFGEKDYQQLKVVTQMAKDLDIPIRIVPGATVREKDGLALSSRNAYLSPEERPRAADLSRSLFAARARAAHGERDARSLEVDVLRQLEAAGLAVDYVEAVDAETMARAAEVRPGVALAAAVRLGKTRLIDNVFLLDPARPGE
jgi:pantoate--beta-alanine ligase